MKQTRRAGEEVPQRGQVRVTETSDVRNGAAFESVGALCILEDTVLMLQRQNDRSFPGLWGLPGGRVESGEAREKTILRELYEETGLLRSSANMIFLTSHLVEGPDSLAFVYSTYLTRYRSMPNVVISTNEHLQYDWVPIAQLKDLELVPGTIECIFQALDDELSRYQAPLFTLDEERTTAPDFEGMVDRWVRLGSAGGLDLSHSVAVIGPPGVGKSTLVRALGTGNEIAHYDILADKQSRQRVYLDRFLKGDNSFALLCQVEALASRFWSIKSLETPPYIMDEWIYSTLAYSIALASRRQMRPEEYQTFYVTYASYATFTVPPRLVVHLTAEPGVLRGRIEKRNRSFEQDSHQLAYLAALVDGFNAACAELENTTTVLTVQTSRKSAIEVRREVLQRARDLGIELV